METTANRSQAGDHSTLDDHLSTVPSTSSVAPFDSSLTQTAASGLASDRNATRNLSPRRITTNEMDQLLKQTVFNCIRLGNKANSALDSLCESSDDGFKVKAVAEVNTLLATQERLNRSQPEKSATSVLSTISASGVSASSSSLRFARTSDQVVLQDQITF